MRKLTRIEWFAYAAVVALAALLRFLWLDRIPPGLWYDEAIYALDGLTAAEGKPRIFYDTYGHMREPLYIWSLGAFFKLFGHSTFHARMVSAIWGTATVALLFPLARYLFTTRWALLACLGLAVFRWHLHFSRTIFRALLPSFFIIAVVWFFLRWRESRKTTDAVLCGAALGAGMYTYLSFRLVPLILAAALAWMAWRRELNFRRDIRQLVAMAGAALLLFLPLAFDYLENPEHFTGRTSEITMFEKTVEQVRPDGGIQQVKVKKSIGEALADVGANAWAVARMWAWRGDHVGKHNLPNAPVFDPANALVFFAGIVGCLVYFRSNIFGVLLLAWLVAMSLTSIFSFGAPNILRMQGATPAVILLYVFGLKLVYQVLAPRVSRPICIAFIASLFALFAGQQLYSYFIRFPASATVRREFTADVFYEPAEAVRTVAGRYPLVLIPQELAELPVFRFVLAGLENVEEYPSGGPTFPLSRAPAVVLLTVRSLDLAREQGQDVLASVLRARGTLLRKMSIPVQQHSTAPVVQQPWAELWLIPPGERTAR